jgi:hypothetical protein
MVVGQFKSGVPGAESSTPQYRATGASASLLPQAPIIKLTHYRNYQPFVAGFHARYS